MKKHRVAVRRNMKRAAGIAGISTTLLVSTAALAGGTALLVAGVQMPDSLVANWLVRPLAVVSVASVGSSGGLPTSIGSTTTTTSPGSGATVKPTKLGINLMGPDFSGSSRPFSNLILSTYWGIQTTTGAPISSYLDSNGNLLKAGAGDNISIAMNRPNGVYRGKAVDMVCKWEGKATVRVFNNGAALNAVHRTNEVRFTYVKSAGPAMLTVPSVPDPSQPLKNLDCREAGSDPSQVFDPDYLALLKRFSVLRFMDWQLTNGNKPVTWATRSRMVGQNYVRGQDGYPIETMIDLANAADADAWFCMPWNADADYIRKFAQMVKANLKPGRKVYVELSNEVWNWYFSAAQQASQEGLARGLHTDAGMAQYLRYAEKLGEVMDIWKDVFADQPDRLVRLAAFQAANPDGIKTILQFRNTATKVDAVASAPYLDYDLDANPSVTVNNLTPVFTTLKQRIDQHKINQAKIRTTATQYGKRVITYEGGQHVTGQNTTIQTAIQNDPRMGDIYTAYLRAWQQNSGDLMVLFNDIAPITRYGAWGLLENAGQAPGSTPKGKAVTLFQASISK